MACERANPVPCHEIQRHPASTRSRDATLRAIPARVGVVAAFHLFSFFFFFLVASTARRRRVWHSYAFLAGEQYMRAEILARGPIACLVNSEPLNAYRGGILDAGFDEVRFVMTSRE